MIIFLLAFSVCSHLILRHTCNAPWWVSLAFFGVSIWIGAELYYAYEKGFSCNGTIRYSGNLFVRLSKFALSVCFNLCVIVGSIAFFREPDSLAGEIGLFFFLTVLGFRVICLLVYQPDPAIKDNFDKIRWLDVIHKDILTSDATEEDWHRPRGDEDWHGL